MPGLTDTPPEIAAMVRERLMARSGIARKMVCSPRIQENRQRIREGSSEKKILCSTLEAYCG